MGKEARIAAIIPITRFRPSSMEPSYHYSPFIRLYDKLGQNQGGTREFGLAHMANQRRSKRSGSLAMRYLNSSAHGKVPVLRAGGETYLWMPATSGGENVWRHVLTRGTSPGTVRKRIALKAGIKNSGSQSGLAPSNNPSDRPTSLKNWIN